MSKKRGRKKGTFLIVTGLLLIAAALALVCWNMWQDESAGESSEAILTSLRKVMSGEAAQKAGNESAEGSANGEPAAEAIGTSDETEDGVKGRWVFVPYGEAQATGEIDETNGRWVFVPAETLEAARGTEAAEPVRTAEGSEMWIFVPVGSGKALEEADAQGGMWLLIAKSDVDASAMRFGAMQKHRAVVTYPDYVLNPNMDMPEEEIDGNKYIGVLEVPSLGIRLPVMSEWSYPKLRIAPCRYSGTAYLDDLIICGHNYDRHFGRLKTLNAGDEVRFTDVDGNVFRYQVVELETLKPRAIEQMKSGEWDLTLFTCTIGGATRVTVRCEKI